MEVSTAEHFDALGFTQMIRNRDSRFHLDLANKNLVEVMEAYETYKKRSSPSFKNSSATNFLRRFQNYTNCTIMPIDITDEFYSYANEYLSIVPNEQGKTLKPTSICNYFDQIRAALGWAGKHNCQLSETYNVYKLDHYEKIKVALKPTQIALIYYFKFEDKDTKARMKMFAKEMNIRGFSFAQMKRVQDQFVIECNLGQRYSDASKFTRANFDETGTIFRCTQQKTGGRAVVNILNNCLCPDIAIEILKKYNYEAPCKGMDITYANKYIHLLCRTIGGIFNTKKLTVNKIRGKLVEESVPMWQLITTHTARRSFVTYWASNERMSTVMIQKCTGHKDARLLNTYTIVN